MLKVGVCMVLDIQRNLSSPVFPSDDRAAAGPSKGSRFLTYRKKITVTSAKTGISTRPE